MVAVRCGIPVIPVTLVGSRALLPDETLRPHYSLLQVLIDEPLSPEGDDAWQAALKLRDTARSRILGRLGEPDAAA